MVFTLHDALPTFLDENGKPIVGRLIFFQADGTTYKPIYADQNYQTLLPNPLPTDMAGRPSSQPFLKNGIYRVVVEKFIGTNLADMGIYMNETYDPSHLGVVSHWQFRKEFVIDSGNLDTNTLESYELMTVRYISDLRNVDFQTHPVVQVLDYDENLKNITPRTYIWANGSNRSEDYGATIISNLSNTGRWLLCESSIMEATTFGISAYADPGVLASRLNGLETYTQDTYGKAQVVYFQPGSYKLLNGTQLNFKKPVVCNGNLRFYLNDPDNESAKIYFSNGLEYEGTQEINGKNVELKIRRHAVKTSWYRYDGNSSSYDGTSGWYDTVVMDKDDGHTRAFSHCEVIIDAEINNASLSFEDCRVALNQDIKKAGCTFTDCTFANSTGKICATVNINGSVDIYPQMFDTAYTNINIDEDVRYELQDWGADAYVFFKQMQNITNIGSLDGQELTTTPTLENNTVISDFSGDVVATGVSATLRNWSGSVETNGSTVLNLYDSTANIDGTAVKNLNLQGVVLTVEDDEVLVVGAAQHAGPSSLVDSSVNAKLEIRDGITFTRCNILKIIDANNVDADVFVFDHCNITAQIDCRDISLLHCTIDALINETAQNNLDFIVSYCTFGENGLHKIQGISGSSVKCKGTWAHNLSLRTDKHFIEVDRSHLSSDESQHDYIYEDNRGPKVLQRDYAIWNDTLTFYEDYENLPATAVKCAGAKTINDVICWYGKSELYPYEAGESNRGRTITSSYATEFELFSVGILAGQFLLKSIPSMLVTTETEHRLDYQPYPSEFDKSVDVVVHTQEARNNMPKTMWHVSEFKYRLSGDLGIRGKMLTADYMDGDQDIGVRFKIEALNLEPWSATFYL